MSHKSFNYKQVISVIVLVVGLCGIGYAVSSGKKLNNARGFFDSTSSLIPGKSRDIVSSAGHSKLNQYGGQLTMLWIGSIALVVLGGAGTYFLRDKK